MTPTYTVMPDGQDEPTLWVREHWQNDPTPILRRCEVTETVWLAATTLASGGRIGAGLRELVRDLLAGAVIGEGSA